MWCISVFLLCHLLVVTTIGTQTASNHNVGRIVGGTIATIEDNPWQVSLQVFSLHQCGGSIVSPDIILTAAHCFDGIVPILYEVVSGTNNLISGGFTSKIKNFVTHEKFNGYSHDVALIFLEESLVFSATTQAVPLTETEPSDGQTVTVTGFGALSESDDTASDVLYSVDVSIINREKCAAQYINVNPIDDTMLCAGDQSGGKDACTMDSGGPLTQDGILVGIVSWGSGCGNVAYPGVYTNVASVRAWIKTNAGI